MFNIVDHVVRLAYRIYTPIFQLLLLAIWQKTDSCLEGEKVQCGISEFSSEVYVSVEIKLGSVNCVIYVLRPVRLLMMGSR